MKARNSRNELDGWRSARSRSDDGGFESCECVRVAGRVVEFSEQGAHMLGDRYWLAVAHASRGAVRRRDTPNGIELRLLGRRPCLLRFGPALHTVAANRVRCRYAIEGGLLARQRGGELILAQSGSAPTELHAAVRGFVPRWSGTLYEHVQQRLHVTISRRYFRRLIEEAS